MHEAMNEMIVDELSRMVRRGVGRYVYVSLVYRR